MHLTPIFTNLFLNLTVFTATMTHPARAIYVQSYRVLTERTHLVTYLLTVEFATDKRAASAHHDANAAVIARWLCSHAAGIIT